MKEGNVAELTGKKKFETRAWEVVLAEKRP